MYDYLTGKLAKSIYINKIQEVFNRTITYEQLSKELSAFENGNIVNKAKSEYSEIAQKKLQLGGTKWNGAVSLNGNIYAVRIYNRVLTDEEIKTNYKIDKYRFGITE